MSAAGFPPPAGQLPVLQYCMPAQLAVDAAYQRSIETQESQRLIARIARGWDWRLCQPLVVSLRADRQLYVVDGQHRLEAARLRGDIPHLLTVMLVIVAIAVAPIAIAVVLSRGKSVR